MRDQLVFAASKIISNPYRLASVAARTSRELRHPYKHSIADSINLALSRIGKVEEPRPLPAPRWRDLLARKVARDVAPPEEVAHGLPTSAWPKPENIADVPSPLERLARAVAAADGHPWKGWQHSSREARQEHARLMAQARWKQQGNKLPTETCAETAKPPIPDHRQSADDLEPVASGTLDAVGSHADAEILSVGS